MKSLLDINLTDSLSFEQICIDTVIGVFAAMIEDGTYKRIISSYFKVSAQNTGNK
ncbi:MAG: hypothetical protein OFPI_38240 [Osedax symbiont Rs2]|nr:MAG: hypothetical protein OFPI_38240 [Osedax symbiont Rs2]